MAKNSLSQTIKNGILKANSAINDSDSGSGSDTSGPKSKEELLQKLRGEKEWIYFKTVHAHRAFMHAMSMYKLKRYGNKRTDEIGEKSKDE